MVKGSRSPVDTRGLSGKGSGDCDAAVTYHWACITAKSYLKTGKFKAVNHVIECNLNSIVTLPLFFFLSKLSV